LFVAIRAIVLQDLLENVVLSISKVRSSMRCLVSNAVLLD
jgi:hypothetical protein